MGKNISDTVKNIVEKLRKYNPRMDMLGELSTPLGGMTTNIQNGSLSDIVFYKLYDNQKSKELLRSRAKNIKVGLLILNMWSDELNTVFSNQSVLILDEKYFLEAEKELLDFFYPLKREKFKLVGITGTNGKTTVVNLSMQVSTLLGHPAISIGTLGVNSIEGNLSDLEVTTPSYIELRKLFYNYQNDYQVFFFEVSSHALEQNRLNDLRLDLAAWTNFTQDHLDYHKSMENYFLSKSKIYKCFMNNNSQIVVPSCELDLYKRIDYQYKFRAKSLIERGYRNLPLFYSATFNQSNLELAFELNERLWGFLPKFDLNLIQLPKGRFSMINLPNNNLAIIDYAHTPDALINITSTIAKDFPNYTLNVVFGCGGNRDRSKRKLMAEAAKKFATKIYITSDNPRNENPDDILCDIEEGLQDRVYYKNSDRRETILQALSEMKQLEILLIAGKGHEEYQEINGIKHPFSDFKIVNEYSNQ